MAIIEFIAKLNRPLCGSCFERLYQEWNKQFKNKIEANRRVKLNDVESSGRSTRYEGLASLCSSENDKPFYRA